MHCKSDGLSVPRTAGCARIIISLFMAASSSSWAHVFESNSACLGEFRLPPPN
jgi:hypothetical protein